MSTLRVRRIQRFITIVSSLLLIAALLITVGTYFTLVNLQLSLGKVQRTQTASTLSFILPIKLQNQGFFEIQLELMIAILSNQTLVAENTSAWNIQPGGVSSYLFEIHLTNTTSIQYINSTSTNTLVEINASGSTSYGLFGLELQGTVPAKNV